jgi:hypothetical protein
MPQEQFDLRDEEEFDLRDEPESPQQSGFVNDVLSPAWQWANTPLVDLSEQARSVAEWEDPVEKRTEDQWRIPSWIPIAGGGTWRSLGAGMDEGLVNVISGLTSPLNLAAGAVGLGTWGAGARGLSRTSQGLHRVGQTLGAGQVVHGGQTVFDPNATLAEKAFGVAEMAGGGAGIGAPRPTVRPRATRPKAEVKPLTQVSLPFEEQVVGPRDPRISGLAPERAVTEFDLQPAVEPPPPLKFAEQVVPEGQLTNQDMFRLSREIAEPARPPRPAPPEMPPEFQPVERPVVEPEVPPIEKGATWSDYLERLKQLPGEESGEFNPEFWRRRRESLDRNPATDVSDETQIRGRSSTELMQAIRGWNERYPGGLMDNYIVTAIRELQNRFREGGHLPQDIIDLANGLGVEADRPSALRMAGGRTTPSTPEPSAPRVNPEDVPRSYRDSFVDWDAQRLEEFIERFEGTEGYSGPVGQNILNHARDVLDQRFRALTSDAAVDVEAGLESPQPGDQPIRVTLAIMDALDRIPEEHIQTFIRHYNEPTFHGTRSGMADYLTGRLQEVQRRQQMYRNEPYRPPMEMEPSEAVSGWESIDTSTGESLPVRPPRELRMSGRAKLSGVVGEELAAKLKSGELEVPEHYPPDAPVTQKGRLINKAEAKHWNESGNQWVEDYVEVNPNKPGMEIVEDTGRYNMEGELVTDPRRFQIKYRDADGKGIGYIRSDGHGIVTLAVDSRLGLRRGKIAFEMLAESLKRGVDRPSGGTSDMTKNLIERARRLIRDTSGEFNPQVIIDLLNDLMGKGKQLIEDVSGAFDPDAFRNLINKIRSGKATPEEMATAEAMFNEQAKPVSGAEAVKRAASDRMTPEQRAEMIKRRQEAMDARNKGFQGIVPDEAVVEATPEDVQAAAPVPLRQQLTQATQPKAQPRQAPQLPPKIPVQGKLPMPPGRMPRKGALINKQQLKPGIKVRARKVKPETPIGNFSYYWNTIRAAQSIDLPGITSAAMRQASPLRFTPAWFKSWETAAKAFGSDKALGMMTDLWKNNKYIQARYEPRYNSKGDLIQYVEMPSIAEELGLSLTDILNKREEAISSSLVERVPVYGRYAKASNRAYTAFLNNLRVVKFEQLMDAAYAAGKNPLTDKALGKNIAEFVNNATGRGSLDFGLINLEPSAGGVGNLLYSPRALSARLRMLDPRKYTTMDPFVRQQYWKSMASIVGGWAAMSGLAYLMNPKLVSLNPSNPDFGKIKIGNTRLDPGAGYQQLMVIAGKEAMGGSTSSTSQKFTPFGKNPMIGDATTPFFNYAWNQANPSIRLLADLINAARGQGTTFDVTDKTLQSVLPMYIADIAKAAEEDDATAAIFAGILSSMGIGAQTYEAGDFGKPEITPFINDVLGNMFGRRTKVPTIQIGRER